MLPSELDHLILGHCFPSFQVLLILGLKEQIKWKLVTESAFYLI